MATVFHVDRSRALAPGATIDLQAAPEMPHGGPDLSVLLPGGLTTHGAQYLASAMPFDGSVVSEMAFEMVRRSEFPDVLSRYQAVFGFEDLAGARAFRHQYVGDLTTPIVQLEADIAHRANLSLIRWATPAATVIARAREYWQGIEGSAAPLWEVLLHAPARVLDAVGEQQRA